MLEGQRYVFGAGGIDLSHGTWVLNLEPSAFDSESIGVTLNFWNSSAQLQVKRPPLDIGWFGMAETGAGANGWYGEDCIDGTDTTFDMDVCHSIRSGGLNLGYTTAATLVEDADRTLFQGQHSDSLTYYVATQDREVCWTWGDDPSYYKDRFGCLEK